MREREREEVAADTMKTCPGGSLRFSMRVPKLHSISKLISLHRCYSKKKKTGRGTLNSGKFRAESR